MARPSKIELIDLGEVEKLGALGLTEVEIADWLGICKATVTNYKRQYPEFLAAIKRGKSQADAAIIRSLYNKAKAGDTTAMIFWLKNRRNQDWRDIKAVEHSGHISDKAPDLSKLEYKDLKKLAEMAN